MWIPTQQHLVDRYASLENAALIEYYSEGRQAFSSEAWQILLEEFERRGLERPLMVYEELLLALSENGRPATADIVRCAQELVVASQPRSEAIRQLVDVGVPSDIGTKAVAQADDTARTEREAASALQTRVGWIFLIGGIAITVLSYAAAATHGGRYVVAVGAVAFGLIQIARGSSNA
jgi:hypothetical protein